MKLIKKRLFAVIVCLLVVVALVALVACKDTPSEQSKKLDYITLNTDSVKTEFTAGDELTYVGLEVTAHYDDETSATVTDYSVIANSLDEGKLTVDSNTATVSYTEDGVTKTATYAITVTAGATVPDKEVKSIAINQGPTTTEYYVGETVSMNGLKIDVTYVDETTKTITTGFATSTVSTATADTITVTVTYGGKTATFSVTVYDKLTGLIVTGADEYSVGDEFAGVTVKALYNGATTGGVALDSSKYSLKVNPELTEGKFVTAGDYVATITYYEELILGRKLEVSKPHNITVTNNGTGGGDENLPRITDWDTSGEQIYGEVHENGSDYIYHHLFLNDAVAKQYDFDSYQASVTLDGVAGEIVEAQAMNAENIQAHTYHMHIRIKGNRYQTAVFTIQFQKDGKTVAIGTYTRLGDKEVVLDAVVLPMSKGDNETVSIISVNGKTDYTGLKISWSITDTEGDNVATIPDNSNGTSVVVTAVSAGKATLTCTIGEGENAFSKTCVITVVEGEVEIIPENLSQQMVFSNIFTHDGKDAIQVYCNLQGPDFADLVQQIDPSQTTVTVTMDGSESTCIVARREWQGVGDYNLWIQIAVESDWTHDYQFRISFKNAKGVEVAFANYAKEAERSLKLDKSAINLEIGAEAGTVTAIVSGKVEGTIEWSISGDNAVATIQVNDGNMSVTVTAVAKGTATITATVDGLTATCTVNVYNEGESETPPGVKVIVITGTDFYAGNFVKIAMSNEDLQFIIKNADHVVTNGKQQPHNANKGYLVDGNVIQVQFDEGETVFECNWYDASGNLIAICTFTK